MSAPLRLLRWKNVYRESELYRERQVLGYHKKRGTTSPLYEKIKAKYPNW